MLEQIFKRLCCRDTLYMYIENVCDFINLSEGLKLNIRAEIYFSASRNW
jgi:hypothetical protein